MNKLLGPLMRAQGALAGCGSLQSVDQVGAHRSMIQQVDRQLAALTGALDSGSQVVQFREENLGSGQLPGTPLFFCQAGGVAEVAVRAASSTQNEM